MPSVATVISPLFVTLPRKTKADKRYALNLNVYRNSFHIVLNQAKIIYKEAMQEQIQKIPELKKIAALYTLFPKTKRLTDIHNVCIIHEKFFMDALVEAGKLPDDNYLYYCETVYRFGIVDPSNPRVEIEIYEL